MSDIFKAYDVRGIYPNEINREVAFKLGNAVAQYFNAKFVVIGEDGRSSSPELSKAVADGVNSFGSDVVYLGKTTTPVFYFASRKLNSDAGIMITSSHNPLDYNGFKITENGGIPIGGGAGMDGVKRLFEREPAISSIKGQFLKNFSFKGEYLERVIHLSGLRPGKITKKIVVDFGNGVSLTTGEPILKRLKINYSSIFCNENDLNICDPNPSTVSSLDKVMRKVIEEKADLGIAFDGDVDRLIVINERGEIVPPQYILGLLWIGDWKFFFKPGVVYDARFSKALKELFGTRGIKSKVGHTNIVDSMIISGAKMGGEISGHYYFKDIGYTECPELAFLKLIKILEKTGKPLSKLIEPMKKYYYSGEITIENQNSLLRQGYGGQANLKSLSFVETTEGKQIFQKLKGKYNDGKIDEFDGLTVNYTDWWFNVRFSNTEPAVRMVVEAKSQELMKQKIEEIKSIIMNGSP